MEKRRPLNQQTIVFYYNGVNKGQFGKGEHVTLYDIRETCERGENCENNDEHLTFDGQIFFKKEKLCQQ
jgi:hypothetical protein